MANAQRCVCSRRGMHGESLCYVRVCRIDSGREEDGRVLPESTLGMLAEHCARQGTGVAQIQTLETNLSPSGGDAALLICAARCCCFSRMRKVATPSFCLRSSSTHFCGQAARVSA